MQPSQALGKVGYIWVLIQWIWTFKKLIAIIGLTLTLLGLLWAEVLEQRQFMRDAFDEKLAQLARVEAGFKSAGDEAFALPAREGGLISRQAAERLYDVAQDLQSELSSFAQPTGRLDDLRDVYAGEVADVIGALNLYKPGVEETVRVLTDLDEADRAGGAYRAAAENYRNSVWATFWSAF